MKYFLKILVTRFNKTNNENFTYFKKKKIVDFSISCLTISLLINDAQNSWSYFTHSHEKKSSKKQAHIEQQRIKGKLKEEHRIYSKCDTKRVIQVFACSSLHLSGSWTRKYTFKKKKKQLFLTFFQVAPEEEVRSIFSKKKKQNFLVPIKSNILLHSSSSLSVLCDVNITHRKTFFSVAVSCEWNIYVYTLVNIFSYKQAWKYRRDEKIRRNMFFYE